MQANNAGPRILLFCAFLFHCSYIAGPIGVAAAQTKPQPAHPAASHRAKSGAHTKRRTSAAHASAHKAAQSGSYMSLVNQAKSLVDKNKNAAAYERAMSAARLAPTKPDAYFFAGVAALHQDQFDRAEQLVKRAASLTRPAQIQLSSDCQDVLQAISKEREFRAYINTARQAGLANRPADAAKSYEDAYAVYPVRADIGLMAASARLETKDYSNAKRLLDQVMAGAVNDSDRAIALNLQNKLADVQQQKDEAARRVSDLADLRKTIDSAKDALTQKQQELQTRTDSLKSLRVKKDDLTSRHDALMRDATDAEAKKQQSLDAATQAANTAQTFRDSAAQAQQAQQDAIAANNGTQAILSAVKVRANKASAQKYDKTAAKNRDIARQWSDKAQEVRKQADPLQVDIDALQAKISGAEADIDGLTQDIKKIQVDIDKFTVESRRLQDEIDHTKTQ